MKRILLLMQLALLATAGLSFCGFYVSKAGADLFNNRSEVIFVRDGDHSTITMSNDFNGDVKDFAMVVPVPHLLEEKDIRIADRSLFSLFDGYSAPRLAEYYDPNPCDPVIQYDRITSMRANRMEMATESIDEEIFDNYQVTVEATYHVEEYEILILSAKESDGLKRWLTDNGYAIPANAEKVLDPYIKSNMKFFVVKVDLNKYDPTAHDGYLRPLQISLKTDRFMLPIRLGMANAKDQQDMIVYSFTRTGRVETTNYRTVELPTAKEIPTFVEQRFNDFYKDMFTQQYEREGRNAVFLEYAWNVSPSWAGVKCDPCVGDPPYFDDLAQAGVSWIQEPDAQVFFTRLHVRYTQDKFPEDLFFHETPNRAHFQVRQVIRHPASGDLSCLAGKDYLRMLQERRKKELHQLAALTAWEISQFESYVEQGSIEVQQIRRMDQEGQEDRQAIPPTAPRTPRILLFMSSLLLLIHIGIQLRRRFNHSYI